MNFKIMLLVCGALISIACMSTTAPAGGNEKRTSFAVNNSDPRKPNYVDPSSSADLLAAKNRSIALKIASNPLSGSPALKASDVYPIGTLTTLECPGFSLPYTIYMDDENTDNMSQLYFRPLISTGVWTHGMPYGNNRVIQGLYAKFEGVTQPMADQTNAHVLGTKFSMCRYDLAGQIPAARIDYAVFRIGNSCPPGSYPFARYIDNEDDDNSNALTESMASTSQDRNSNVPDGRTRLEFCFVPKNASSKTTFWFNGGGGFNGVFAPTGVNPLVGTPYESQKGYCNYSGWVITDDEDNNNANSWDFYGMPQAYIDRIHAFMGITSETHMTFTWCNSTNTNTPQ